MGHVQKDRLLLKKIRVNLLTHKYLFPTNLEKEKEKFFKDNKYNPQLIYSPFPKEKFKQFEELLLKIKYNNDNTLVNNIFTDKINETFLKLRLILTIGTSFFTNASLKLYRLKFDNKTLIQARKDSQIKATFKSPPALTNYEAAKKINDYLNKNSIYGWMIILSKRSDFYFQVFPKSKIIKVGKYLNWESADLDYFLAHEVDGHVIRSQNAGLHRQKIFKKPFPFYIKTEEGLASYLGNYHSKNGEVSKSNLAIRYLAGYFAKTHSFSQTYRFLIDHGFSKELAFQKTLRLKRGFTNTSMPGVYAREAMYYEGMMEVKDYLDNGGNLRKLFAGKIGLSECASIPIPQNQILPRRLSI